jgi:hypothetical protein
MKNRQLKTVLLAVFSLFTTFLFGQKVKASPADSLAFSVIEKRYKGGTKAFFTDMSKTLLCPQEAVDNCRLGTVLLTVKIRSSGVIDSVLLKNDVEIGMGIEPVVVNALLLTKGNWTRAVEYATFSFSIAFCEADKDKPDATMLVTLLTGSNCPSNSDLTSRLEKAKKKKKYKEAAELCEDLLRRLPNSAQYKTELAELKRNF